VNVNEIIEQFFDLSKPCPSQIVECEQIRGKYKAEVDALTAEGCSQCKKNGVKAKYLQDVWKSAISSLTEKAS